MSSLQTPLYVIRRHFQIKSIIKMDKAITRIAIKNITDLRKIEEVLKNANR